MGLHEDEPAEEQANRVVDRLAQDVDVRPFLGPYRRHVVDDAHDPQRRRRQEEGPVDRPGEYAARDGQAEPLDIGRRNVDEPGRDGPGSLERVVTIVARVEDLVQHVVAGRHQARREDSCGQPPPSPAGQGVWSIRQRQDDAEEHEAVLEPVIRPRDLDVRPHVPSGRAGLGRGG
jgi:hypothetical protein